MESRRVTIENHKRHGRTRVKQAWKEKLKSIFITFFCIGIIVFLIYSFVY